MITENNGVLNKKIIAHDGVDFCVIAPLTRSYLKMLIEYPDKNVNGSNSFCVFSSDVDGKTVFYEVYQRDTALVIKKGQE
jgi:hypothetical protein